MLEKLMEIAMYATFGFIVASVFSIGAVMYPVENPYDDPSDGGSCHAQP